MIFILSVVYIECSTSNIIKEAVKKYDKDAPLKVLNAEGKEVTLYVMCFVLSHSRYKYCEWQTRPFNTSDIIRIHENAFEYYGGFPEEAVYDQDHLILVSENHGELIYTKEFAAYLQKRRFKVYMCRKGDPESKN